MMKRGTVKNGITAAVAILLLSQSPVEAAHDGSGPVGDDFTLKSVDLKFVDGSKTMVVTLGDEIMAIAEITFSGSGLLSGAWEIAEPTTTPGAVKYRNLLLINKNIAENRQDILRTPALPVKITGSYLLRLKINRPPTDTAKLVLKYFVGDEHPDEELAGGKAVPETIATEGPAKSGPAKSDTKFTWDAVPGSVAYQVEIYDKKGGEGGVITDAGTSNFCMIRVPSELNRPPTMGVMVPAFQTEATLNQLAGRVLMKDTSYLWRVVALAKGGEVLCQSPFKEFVYTD